MAIYHKPSLSAKIHAVRPRGTVANCEGEWLAMVFKVKPTKKSVRMFLHNVKRFVLSEPVKIDENLGEWYRIYGDTFALDELERLGRKFDFILDCHAEMSVRVGWQAAGSGEEKPRKVADVVRESNRKLDAEQRRNAIENRRRGRGFIPLEELDQE